MPVFGELYIRRLVLPISGARIQDFDFQVHIFTPTTVTWIQPVCLTFANSNRNLYQFRE